MWGRRTGDENKKRKLENQKEVRKGKKRKERRKKR